MLSSWPATSSSPVVLVLLCSAEQILDVLGDLLCLANDILGAGERRVWLGFKIIQFRDGAALPKPATAPKPPPPAHTARGGRDSEIKDVTTISAPLHPDLTFTTWCVTLEAVATLKGRFQIWQCAFALCGLYQWIRCPCTQKCVCSYPESSNSESLVVLS